MSSFRSRLVTLATGLALSLTMVSAPAVLAQDSPEDTFTGFVEAFESFDLAELPTYFCAEQADALGGIGMGALTAGIPAGFDFMLDAIEIDVEVDSFEVVSQTESEAILEVAATASMTMDIEAILPMLVGMLESFGATEDDIAQMQAEMAADIPESETFDLSGQITLVPGEVRPWVICSDLGALGGMEITADEPGEAVPSEEPAADTTADGTDGS